jgi:putative colanic acid biosynthesis glycosyltransferase
MKTKVLLINVVFGEKSTGRLVSSIYDELNSSKDFEPYVIVGRRSKQSPSLDRHFFYPCTPFYSKLMHFLCRLSGNPYGFCFFSTFRIKKYIKKLSPDLINIHCINGYFVNIPSLLKFLKKRNIPLVVTNHAEFYFTGNCSYSEECREFMKTPGCNKCPRVKEATETFFFNKTEKNFRKMFNSFSSYKNIEVVSVSPWLSGESKKSLILGSFKNVIIPNGVDGQLFNFYNAKPLNEETRVFFKKKKIVLISSANGNSPNKGARFIPKLLDLLGEDMAIAVIGGNDSYNSDRIVSLGYISDPGTLSAIYRSAFVLVSFSKRETFSMTIAEAACCGLFTISFDSLGPSSVFDSRFARFVPYGDLMTLAKEISIHTEDENSRQERSKEALAIFSKEKMNFAYEKEYNNLLKDCFSSTTKK